MLALQGRAVGYPVLTCDAEALAPFGGDWPGVPPLAVPLLRASIDACRTRTLRGYCDAGDAEACDAIGDLARGAELRRKLDEGDQTWFDFLDESVEENVEEFKDAAGEVIEATGEFVGGVARGAAKAAASGLWWIGGAVLTVGVVGAIAYGVTRGRRGSGK